MGTIYDPKSFEEQDFNPYASSPKGKKFTALPTLLPLQKDAIASRKLFAYEDYQELHNLPLEVFSINSKVLTTPLKRCLDLPLRLAGTHTYCLPEEWESLLPAIQAIVDFEHAHNSDWMDYNCYLTVDYSTVTPGEQQRHGGLHVDGFQGTRIQPKTLINRSYVATSNGGTLFYKPPFIVADPHKWNAFQGFDLQANADFFTAKENLIYLMDAYTVHESGFARFAGPRGFLRVSFDVKEFDRWGNTHNSMLDYSWDMVTRNAHEMVSTPTLQDILESPHRRPQ